MSSKITKKEAFYLEQEAKELKEKSEDTLLIEMVSVLSKLARSHAEQEPRERNSLNENDECPDCGVGKMVIRHRKTDNKRFLGCNQFPSCKNACEV